MTLSIDSSKRIRRYRGLVPGVVIVCLVAASIVVSYSRIKKRSIDYAKLSTVQLETLSSTQPSLQASGELFKRAIGASDSRAAKDIASKMVQQYPRDARANNALGVACAEARDPDGAKKAFHDSIALDPHFVDPCVNLGKLAMLMGDYQKAADEFDRATTVDAKSPNGWIGLGEANVELHNMQEAIESFQHALKIAPNNAQAHAHLGAFLAEMGRGDEARPHLQRAQELGDKSSILDAGLAMAYADQPQSQDELRKALDYVESAEKKGQTDGLVEYAHGLALQRLNRYNEAIDAYKRVIQLSLNANGAWMGMSQCYRATGRAKLADAAAQIGERVVSQRQHVNNLRYVIRASPGRLDLRIEYAALMMSTQQYDVAAGEYQYIAEHSPGKPACWLKLAHALDLAGKKDLADQARHRASKEPSIRNGKSSDASPPPYEKTH